MDIRKSSEYLGVIKEVENILAPGIGITEEQKAPKDEIYQQTLRQLNTIITAEIKILQEIDKIVKKLIIIEEEIKEMKESNKAVKKAVEEKLGQAIVAAKPVFRTWIYK